MGWACHTKDYPTPFIQVALSILLCPCKEGFPNCPDYFKHFVLISTYLATGTGYSGNSKITRFATPI